MLHYHSDWLNVVRAATAPLIFFYPFVFGFPRGYALAAVALAFLVIGDMNYVLHLHIHHPFTKSNLVNGFLDILLGSVTGMTSANWRIQHKYGHHRGRDLPYCSPKEWETAKYSVAGALSFSIRSIWPTYYQPLLESFRKGIVENVRRPLNYRRAFIEEAGQIAFLAGLSFWSPLLVFGYVLPWYAVVYFISRYVDYLNHYGCGTGKFDCANNCVHPRYNFFKHNFGYHTAHHLFADAHWSKLPGIHERIRDQIPPDRVKTFSWSFLLMPYHFIRSVSGRM